MKILITIRLIFVVILLGTVEQMTHGQQNKLQIPNIPGFTTLKCDFHMHTAYSDGNVWPTLRVTEAVRDGIDAISISDHDDYQGFPEIIKSDYNMPYEIAKKAAEKSGIIVIKGVEISPRVPPYHNNAIFLNDANLPADYMKETAKKFVMKDNIMKHELMAPFIEAQKQGAFVFYNHPGYSWWDKKDTAIFTSFHEELWKKGILQGVEVVNSGVYNIIAHRIADKYNLTMLGNSDEHNDIYYRYRDKHRPMTLVFAKERSEAGIKEALIARRTAIYSDKLIIARHNEAEALFLASLNMKFTKLTRNGEPILICEFINTSSFIFNIRVRSEHNIEAYPLGLMTVEPNGTTRFVVKELWKYPPELILHLEVHNVVTSPDHFLETELKLTQSDSTYIYSTNGDARRIE